MTNNLKLSKYSLIVKGRADQTFICNSKNGTYNFISNNEALSLERNEPSFYESIDRTKTQELIDQGILIDDTNDEEIMLTGEGTPTAFLIPTYDCNLRCQYCFQYMAASAENGYATDILEKVFRIIEEKGYDSNPIYLFGGEPLMRKNRQFLEQFFQGIKEKHWKYAMFTNGTQIDYYADLFEQYAEYCDHMHITIDGGKRSHDNRRGKDTYELIEKNIKTLLTHNIPVKVRVNIDSETIETLSELVDNYSQINTNNLISIYFAGIRESHCNTKVDNTNFVTDDTRRVLLDIKGKNDIELKNFMGLDVGKNVKEQVKLKSRSQFCNPKVLFDVQGNCYPCISSTAFPEFSIGTIDSYKEQDIFSSNWWKATNSINKVECTNCQMFYFCGGGCNMEWHQNNVYRCKEFIENNIRFSLNYYLDGVSF